MVVPYCQDHEAKGRLQDRSLRLIADLAAAMLALVPRR